MKITFIGATHEVTGSCILLEACGKNILIDCGMEQGKDYFENVEIPVSAVNIDYLLLTHAHIDHSGLIPLLFKNGFSGEIHSTDATMDLCNIMLRDSAHIQEFEAEWRNRKGKRTGKDEVEPVYTMDDAIGSLELFVPHNYNEKAELCTGIEINFIDVGHLLGSSSIEVFVTEDSKTQKIVFSGDIGNTHQPLIRDPQYIKQADYVIMESTYGNRTHGERPDYVKNLAEIMNTTFAKGGNLIIPSFAVGRTQELLYFIREIKEKGLVTFDYKVYVDSPLAVEATQIFKENSLLNYDEEAMALLHSGVNPINFRGLYTSVSSQDSKDINFDPSLKVIISASGMCEAGRIKHHLKHNLWDENNTVLFVGYQAEGSLGRNILEGQKKVKIFGEEIAVNARIETLQGISGHADKNGLLKWLDAFEEKPKKVFVVHGEATSCESFKDEIILAGYDAIAPYSGCEYDLTNDCYIVKAAPKPITKKTQEPRTNTAFGRLSAAGDRLLEVIRNSEGIPNKELAKFADQILSLCEKWKK